MIEWTTVCRMALRGGSGGGPGDGDPGIRETQTSIGSLGKIKQSPEIKWRLIPGQAAIVPAPTLRGASGKAANTQLWRGEVRQRGGGRQPAAGRQ